ncbi:MAG: nitroreductase family protein [Actinomycetota bacterium]
METLAAIRRRRMIRRFADRSVPPEVLDRVLRAGLHAPSAGFAQGTEFVVLDEPGQLDAFWEITDPWGRKHGDEAGAPPVIAVPFANKLRYLQRYSEPDKHGLGMDVEEGWPVPYWDIDAGMAAMLVLLAAVDEGLGGWFFGIFHGEGELLRLLGAPNDVRPIGAIGLGYPHPDEVVVRSARSRARRPVGEVVHRGRF